MFIYGKKCLQLLVATVLCVGYVHGNPRFLPITKTRILKEKFAIEGYIRKLESDMSPARKAAEVSEAARLTARFGAWATYGLTYKAFDAIPAVNFTDPDRRGLPRADLKAALDRLMSNESIEYMDQGKKLFIEKYLNRKQELKTSELAEFLHDRLVDHLDITDAEKQVAKNNPLSLAEYLRQNKITTEQYAELTCRNYAIDYYVHKEMGKLGGQY
jgi:hypothetical protein